MATFLNSTPQSINRPEIIYLTPPMQVSMGDAWFEIASPEHFWMIRRFDVTCALAGDIITTSKRIAEIGCGNGALQAQIESYFGVEVDGFDLNEYALKLSVAKRSPRYCYNILERREDLRDKYNLIFLFDIVEHIDDQYNFLDAVLHHLAPGGHVIINVPALPWFFSIYDQAVGHLRRYTISMLLQLAREQNLVPKKVSYWGLPIVPLLLIRKLILTMRKQTNSEVLNQGFRPPTPLWNKLLGILAKFEPLPQCLLGSSAFIVFQKSASNNEKKE